MPQSCTIIYLANRAGRGYARWGGDESITVALNCKQELMLMLLVNLGVLYLLLFWLD